MKVCIIGIQSQVLDEGMKKTTTYIASELSKFHEVMLVSPRKVIFTFIKDLKPFSPDIIHFTHGPTIRTFLLMKILSFFIKKAKTVMSATHPQLGNHMKYVLRRLKPNLMLVQSGPTKEFFNKLGFNLEYLPMAGVDTHRFIPVSAQEKIYLRTKYNLNRNEFIVLHVGPINLRRNIMVLADLQKKITGQVLIVGSSSFVPNYNLFYFLQNNGCKVWKNYFPDIEHLYQLSDLYIFPTKDQSGAIEIPLTVLEAMSCNLPVVTYPFGALPELFLEGGGLYFVKDEIDILDTIEKVQRNFVRVDTRNLVIDLSWENIARRLVEVYKKLVF